MEEASVSGERSQVPWLVDHWQLVVSGTGGLGEGEGLLWPTAESGSAHSARARPRRIFLYRGELSRREKRIGDVQVR